MEFRDSYRMEAIYFQTLKEEINRVKALMASGNTEQAKTLLENAVNVDGAVLLLYRNLGELWGELGAKIEEVKKELEKLDSRVDDYHRELNEKIDDVNNTIIRLINALEERVQALEECCEDVQEALANKQDKLIAGDGIGINNENVIRVNNNDIFTSESIGSVLRPYITRTVTRKPFRATTKTLYELVDTIVLSTTGAQLKELLSKYNALKFNFLFGISSNLASNILAVDDIVKISLRRYSFPIQFITFMDRVKLNSIATKTDQGIDVDACSISFAIMNLQNVLHNLVDETVYSFSWEMAYYVEVNGNAITSADSPYFGYINPENYTPSIVGVRGEF